MTLKSIYFKALIGSLIINSAMFISLPMLENSNKKHDDLESLNVVSFSPKRIVQKEEIKDEKIEERETRRSEKIEKPFEDKIKIEKPELKIPQMDLGLMGDIPIIDKINDFKPTDSFDFSSVVRESDLDSVPVPTFKKAPRYPYNARRRKIEGVVEVEFTVSIDGEVSDLVILKSTPPGVFDSSVIQAVSSWRYSPGEIMDKKVSARVSTSIVFKLGE